MKETMKRLLCLVMAMAMVFALVACGEKVEDKEETKTAEAGETEGQKEPAETEPEETEPVETEPVTEPEPTLVGEWVAEMDVSDFVMAGAYELYGEEVDLEFVYEMTLVFDEDGTVEIETDSDSLEDALTVMTEALVLKFFDMCAVEAGMDLEEFIASVEAQGLTAEDLMDASGMTEILATFYETIFEAFNISETADWELEDDQLILDGDKVTIDFDGDLFTVNLADLFGMDEDDVDMEVTFERQ